MPSSKNLRIKRSVSVVAHSPDIVELRSGVWNAESYTLTDHAGSGNLSRLVSGLDGTASRAELAKREGVTRAEVEALVDHLDQLGLIEQHPSTALDAYLDRVDTLSSGAEASPVDTPVFLLGDPAISEAIGLQLDGATGDGKVQQVGPDDPAWRAILELERSGPVGGLELAEAGIAADAWRDGLVVLAESVINPLRFRAVNRLAIETGFTWLHAAVDGPFLFVGPTVIPKRSACYECFETRVAMNLRETAGYLRYKNALAHGVVVAGEQPLIAPLRNLLGSHVALETINYVHTGSAFTVEKVLSIYLPTMEIAYQEVLRLPGCPACGPLPERDDASLYFDARAWIEG